MEDAGSFWEGEEGDVADCAGWVVGGWGWMGVCGFAFVRRGVGLGWFCRRVSLGRRWRAGKIAFLRCKLDGLKGE